VVLSSKHALRHTLDWFRPMREGELPVLDVLEHEAMQVIRGLLVSGHPLLVAYSGGKDSTVVLALALNAARALKEAGHEVPAVIVTHGNTGIENPSVSALAEHEMQKVRDFGCLHGLRVQAEVAAPALNDTWAVSVLSGRKLPTFANSSSRDCTVAYKIQPMLRLRKALLRKGDKPTARPITLIGTRFEESDGRAARMDERGESAARPWEKDGQLFLSPIALWTADDVWELLGRMRSGELEAFTDAADVFDLYAAGGGSSCAVVADMATENAKKSRACGARFGCSLCAAVGRDKSLENMLASDPGYAWLRGLNSIQRYLVDTQYDFDRRNWLGRSLDAEGFVTVTPDTYSPAMLAELLRYCLTVDADEVAAAARARLAKPRFQLVSPQALLAIDAFWGLHGTQDQPFAAIEIWLDVYEAGNRYYPPTNVVQFPVRGFPAPKFIHAGADWDEGAPSAYNGLRDVMREAVDADVSPNRILKDGRTVLELEESALFEVDEHGAGEFLAWEAARVVAQAKARPQASNRAFLYYAGAGLLSTSKRHGGLLDTIARRTNWRRSVGLTGPVAAAKVKGMAVSREERDRSVALRGTPEGGFVGPRQPIPLRMRVCHPVYL
jgi:DNA sulfur modification protein DndC